MSTKLPHMPLWVYDLEADEDCALMSLSEYGAYMKLLQRQWIEGSIPACPARLARLLRVTADEMESIWSALSPKFVQDGRGRLINRRLAGLRDEAAEKVERLRMNGQKGGRPRKENQKVKQTKTKRFSRASESDSDSSSEGECEGKQPDGFSRFWLAYPRKVGKRTAQAAWQRLKLEHQADVVIRAVRDQCASEQWQREGGKFIPHPTTWLNRGSWEDQVGPDPETRPATEAEVDALFAEADDE